MIQKCPSCGLTMSTDHGCGYCGSPGEEDGQPAGTVQVEPKEEPKESKTMTITGQSGLLFGSDCI